MRTNRSLWHDKSGQFSVLEGFIIMWVFIGGGIVLTMALGTIMDQLVDIAVDMNVGISEEWNTLTYCMYLVTDLHLLLILMPIIGIVIFVISVLQKTRYDQYLLSEEEEY